MWNLENDIYVRKRVFCYLIMASHLKRDQRSSDRCINDTKFRHSASDT